ncbi:MAG: ComF family protein [Ruminococcaceae bacterium]|nr:ComF family protein [Oscillospiraceae bacterium]
MRAWLKTVVAVAGQMLFPHHCYLCNEILLPRQRLCPDCAAHAPYILPPVCDRCGRNEDDCHCGGHSRHYARCVSPFYHKDQARRGILYLKEQNIAVTARGFAEAMAETVRREYGGITFDGVVSVPMHKKEWQQRGFDQAAALAKALAKRLEVPYTPVLKKLTHTVPQKELTAVHRRGNLLGVFDVVGEVAGGTYLLVDDVTTTGSTLDECAKMLKIYGAKEVYAVTAAAALLKKDES